MVAEPTLDELQAKLDPEELASAREAAAGLDLDELVSETLGDRVAVAAADRGSTLKGHSRTLAQPAYTPLGRS